MLRDAGFAIRQFFNAPGFTVVAIFTLALAICANLAIFSAADAVLLHPLPYPHPEQLVVVQENLPAHKAAGIPGATFERFKETIESQSTCLRSKEM